MPHSSVFGKDEATVRSFVQLRLLSFVTFLGLFLIWASFAGWVYYRLAVAGFDKQQAQTALNEICVEIRQKTPYHDFQCPKVRD